MKIKPSVIWYIYCASISLIFLLLGRGSNFVGVAFIASNIVAAVALVYSVYYNYYRLRKSNQEEAKQNLLVIRSRLSGVLTFICIIYIAMIVLFVEFQAALPIAMTVIMNIFVLVLYGKLTLFDPELHEVVPKKYFMRSIMLNIVGIICLVGVGVFILRDGQGLWILLMVAVQTAVVTYYVHKIVKPLGKCRFKLRGASQ